MNRERRPQYSDEQALLELLKGSIRWHLRWDNVVAVTYEDRLVRKRAGLEQVHRQTQIQSIRLAHSGTSKRTHQSQTYLWAMLGLIWYQTRETEPPVAAHILEHYPQAVEMTRKRLADEESGGIRDAVG